MAQLDITEVKAFIDELGFTVPYSMLSLIVAKVQEKADCVAQYGDTTANLLLLYASVRLASMSSARRISSQSSPSGASRSFNYDSSGTDNLLSQIRAWDTNNCLSDLALSGKSTGFFAVVG